MDPPGISPRGRRQLALDDNEEVPLLIGTKVAGQFKGFLEMNVRAIDARLDHKFRQQPDEAVHLRAPGDSAAQTLVRAARFALLLQLQ